MIFFFLGGGGDLLVLVFAHIKRFSVFRSISPKVQKAADCANIFHSSSLFLAMQTKKMVCCCFLLILVYFHAILVVLIFLHAWLPFLCILGAIFWRTSPFYE